MENNRKLKIALSVLGLTLLGIGLTYGYQCLICFMDSKAFTFRTFLAMLLLSGGPFILMDIFFIVLAINVMHWQLKEVCEVLMISSILFGILMFILFPSIPVPYSLIPSGEMAMGYLQMLIGIFAAIPAGICFLASVIVLATKRAEQA